MRRAGPLLVALAVVASACSGSAATTTTTVPDTDAGEAEPTTVVPTSQPVVSVDATFALDTLVFGDEGWIEVVNTGPQTGNVHGLWIAVHPYYLELPSAVVEVGSTVRVGLDPAVDALVHTSGLLPVLTAADGEVALYRNGSFGDPTAIVDYVEWGSGGHFRSTVAEAAGLWGEAQVVPMQGDEGGLRVAGGPLRLDADLNPISEG